MIAEAEPSTLQLHEDESRIERIRRAVREDISRSIRNHMTRERDLPGSFAPRSGRRARKWYLENMLAAGREHVAIYGSDPHHRARCGFCGGGTSEDLD